MVKGMKKKSSARSKGLIRWPVEVERTRRTIAVRTLVARSGGLENVPRRLVGFPVVRSVFGFLVKRSDMENIRKVRKILKRVK